MTGIDPGRAIAGAQFQGALAVHGGHHGARRSKPISLLTEAEY